MSSRGNIKQQTKSDKSGCNDIFKCLNHINGKISNHHLGYRPKVESSKSIEIKVFNSRFITLANLARNHITQKSKHLSKSQVAASGKWKIQGEYKSTNLGKGTLGLTHPRSRNTHFNLFGELTQSERNCAKRP